MKYLIILATLFNTVGAYTQSESSSRIGWACSITGSPTEAVQLFNQQLEQRNHQWIYNNLESDDSGYQFMSIIALEILADKGLVSLSPADLNLIDHLKASKTMVYVCSGCTFFEALSMSELFDKEGIPEFRDAAITRFQRIVDN